MNDLLRVTNKIKRGQEAGSDSNTLKEKHEKAMEKSEPAGQEAGRGGDRRREAPEEAVGRSDPAGQGVGAQGHDGRPRRRRRAGQGGARPSEGARRSDDAVRAAVAP